jgi:hypothetical protein
MKYGFGDRKTQPAKSPQELMMQLSEVMSAALNNEVDLDNARVALNAATRIVEVWQADTRMKALAIATNRTIIDVNGWQTIETEKTITSSDNTK